MSDGVPCGRLVLVELCGASVSRVVPECARAAPAELLAYQLPRRAALSAPPAAPHANGTPAHTHTTINTIHARSLTHPTHGRIIPTSTTFLVLFI